MKRTEGNVFYLLTRLHMGQGVHPGWILLADTISGSFVVLGCGVRPADHFCKCGREFDAALERHGAIRIYPRVDCDVDYDEPAERWIDGVLASLAQDKRLAASA